MSGRLAALQSLHPFPSLLVTAVTLAIVPLADRHAPLNRYLSLGSGMALYQFAIGLLNDVVDVPGDRGAKPWKPLARGLLARQTGLLLAIGLALAGLMVTHRLPVQAWLIGVAGLGCGVAYDLYLKRTTLSWLPYAIALPLVPIWVYAASGVWKAFLWWTLPLGTLFGFALQLANQAPDAGAGDRSGLPGALGERRARRLSLVLFGLAALVASAVLLRVSPSRAAPALLLGAGAMALSPWSAGLFGRDGLFGLLAVAGAGIALLFLSAG